MTDQARTVSRLADQLMHPDPMVKRSVQELGARLQRVPHDKESSGEVLRPRGQRQRQRTAPANGNQILTMVVDYCNGAALDVIAKKHLLPTAEVQARLVDAGVNIREEALGHDRRNQFLALRAQGLTTREIGRRFGIAHTTVSRVLRAPAAPARTKQRARSGPSRTSTQQPEPASDQDFLPTNNLEVSCEEWGYQDLNLGPLRYQRSALTA